MSFRRRICTFRAFDVFRVAPGKAKRNWSKSIDTNKNKPCRYHLLNEISLAGEMDDDLTFGTSVWSTSDPVLPPPHKESIPIIGPSTSTTQNDPFDDFDDFGHAVQTSMQENDDFGDFGEFGFAQEEIVEGFPSDGFTEEDRAPVPVSASTQRLILDPMPSREELEMQVNDILRPIWGDVDISEVTSQKKIREVEGIGQILVTPER
jgi:Domain of unknown function (DUF5102)